MCSDVRDIHLIEKDKAVLFERYKRRYYVRFILIDDEVKCEFVGLIPDDIFIIYNYKDISLRQINQDFAICVKME